MIKCKMEIPEKKSRKTLKGTSYVISFRSQVGIYVSRFSSIRLQCTPFSNGEGETGQERRDDKAGGGTRK